MIRLSMSNPRNFSEQVWGISTSVVYGDLADLAEKATGIRPTYAGNDSHVYRLRASSVLESLDTKDILGTTIELIFNAWTGYGRPFDHYDEVLTEHLTSEMKDAPQTLQYLAGRGIHFGTPRSRIASAYYSTRLAKRSAGYQRSCYLSDAGDAMDGWFHGQAPIARRLTYRLHTRAAESSPDRSGGWFLFRAARSAKSRGRWGLSDSLIDQALGTDLTTWEEGHCWRFKAMTVADRGDDFTPQIAKARELFEFASQTRAWSDLTRTEAICHLIRYRDDDLEAARELLQRSTQQHGSFEQSSGKAQSSLLLRLMDIHPRVARYFARMA